MNRTAVYGTLLVFAGTMLLLLLGFVGWQFGWVSFAAGLYALAAKSIWLAFALLLMLQVGWSFLVFWQGLTRYFRREAMAMRRLARLQIHYRDAGQRMILEKSQLHYRNRIKRHRVSFADDKKHSGELFDAINSELRDSMPPDRYKPLRKTLKRYYKRADAQSMLALRRQALCQSSATG
ncbi:MAG: hypothetical protein ACU836_04485 [Gammaproteobacteria bacterium]